MKILGKKWIQIFYPNPPRRGVLKNVFSFKLVLEPKLLNIFVEHMKKGLNPEDEPSISKIERVTAVFVRQVVTKSQIQKNLKSQNITDF